MTRRLSFKLLWLLSLYPIPSSSCFWRSRGESKHFFRNNSWLTCLNPCTIESRIQENHEEHKIFLQKCLIYSRFNQKFHFKKRTIYTRNDHKKSGPFDSLKNIWNTMMLPRLAQWVDTIPRRGPNSPLIFAVWSSSECLQEAAYHSMIHRMLYVIATVGFHLSDRRY